MPVEEYDKLNDSVLAWKRKNKLGRFDPNKDEKEQKELKRQYEEVDVRKISVGARCRVGGADLDRRGTVRYVGEVNEIPNGGVWVGFEADEPTGIILPDPYNPPIWPCFSCIWKPGTSQPSLG